MKKPSMILFDAGGTLINYRIPITDTGISTMDATRALMPYIISNPHGFTAEDIDRYNHEIFGIYDACRDASFEIHVQVIYKALFDLLNIELSIPMSRVEQIVWNKTGDVVAVDGVGAMLSELHTMGIRTAVISNLDFSGYLLKTRMDALLPEHAFEFIIASADYGVRKPNRLLFELGIQKSGLSPQDIWYVGDNFNVDVLGCAAVGMTPVWFCPKGTREGAPERMLCVNDYTQLIAYLKN